MTWQDRSAPQYAYTRVVNYVGGDIEQWPSFILNYVFCEPPSVLRGIKEDFGNLLGVIAFFFGNRVPIEDLVLFLSNANIRWYRRNLLFVRYWYLRFELYPHERKYRSYYNVRHKKVVSLYYNTLHYFSLANRQYGGYDTGFSVDLREIGTLYLDEDCQVYIYGLIRSWASEHRRSQRDIRVRDPATNPDTGDLFGPGPSGINTNQSPPSSPESQDFIDPSLDGYPGYHPDRHRSAVRQLFTESDRSRPADDPDLSYLLAGVFSLSYKDL